MATTKAQRKLFFNLRKAKKRLGWFSQEEARAVADDLGVTTRDVAEMEQRLSSRDVSFESLSTMKPFDAWDAVPDLGKFWRLL